MQLIFIKASGIFSWQLHNSTFHGGPLFKSLLEIKSYSELNTRKVKKVPGADAYLELHCRHRAYYLAIFARYHWLVRRAWVPLFVIYFSVVLNRHIYAVKHEVDIKVQ